MPDFPYLSNYGSLRKFLAHIQTAGVPAKVTLQYLESVGFKSTNDRPIIGVLKSIGFIDGSGVPTKLWNGYRSKDKAGSLMAQAVKQAYSGLFTTYPDANRKDAEALRNYFSTHTSVGEGALGQIVKTFQTLCEAGDFDAVPAVAGLPVVDAADAAQGSVISQQFKVPAGGSQTLVLNLNIELQIPATEDATIYEKFFEAMKKHLLS